MTAGRKCFTNLNSSAAVCALECGVYDRTILGDIRLPRIDAVTSFVPRRDQHNAGRSCFFEDASHPTRSAAALLASVVWSSVKSSTKNLRALPTPARL